MSTERKVGFIPSSSVFLRWGNGSCDSSSLTDRSCSSGAESSQQRATPPVEHLLSNRGEESPAAGGAGAGAGATPPGARDGSDDAYSKAENGVARSREESNVSRLL